MKEQVAIIGIGWAGFSPQTPDVSYKELMYEAALKAYVDANVDPRKDIESFVTVAEILSFPLCIYFILLSQYSSIDGNSAYYASGLLMLLSLHNSTIQKEHTFFPFTSSTYVTIYLGCFAHFSCF